YYGCGARKNGGGAMAVPFLKVPSSSLGDNHKSDKTVVKTCVKKAEEPDENGQCGKIEESCQIGDIYYADDTCSPDVVSGKTPIGVVYDTENKLVVGLEEKTLRWEDYDSLKLKNYTHGTEVSQLVNFMYPTEAKTDFNGKCNTDILVSLGSHPAAQYCHDMTIGGKTWYLPAYGEMQLMYNSTVTNQLDKLGGYVRGWYWSSTEHDSNIAWAFNPSTVVSSDFDEDRPSGYFKNNMSDSKCIFSYAKGYEKDKPNSCTDAEKTAANKAGYTLTTEEKK
ncbi:MAG: hypothetical protein IJ660_04945, partial [Alphaproteobacteria bacterium]|nr:hypothetical protein [Alphaproteobacteria bacterium]